MSVFNPDIEGLIIKFLQQKLSETEHDTLNRWIDEFEDNRLYFQKLTDRQFIFDELNKLYGYDEEKGWRAIERSSVFLNPRAGL